MSWKSKDIESVIAFYISYGVAWVCFPNFQEISFNIKEVSSFLYTFIILCEYTSVCIYRLEISIMFRIHYRTLSELMGWQGLLLLRGSLLLLLLLLSKAELHIKSQKSFGNFLRRYRCRIYIGYGRDSE